MCVRGMLRCGHGRLVHDDGCGLARDDGLWRMYVADGGDDDLRFSCRGDYSGYVLRCTVRRVGAAGVA